MSNVAHEGQSVSYVGDGRDGRALGERGRVLATSGQSGHVKWGDDTITLVDLRDVAPLSSTMGAARAVVRDELDDSLDVGPIVAPGVRGVFQSEGSTGVLQALAGSGQLASFASIAEQTRIYAEGLLRQDPGLMSAVSHLDDEDADEVITLATLRLLREVAGGQ